MNGDGLADVVIGAPGHFDLPGHEVYPSAVVYYGSGSPPYLTAPTTLPSSPCLGDFQLLSAFGGSVSTAGDVDGDGIYDVIIGAPGETYGSSTTRNGEVCIFPGHSGTGVSASSFYRILAPDPNPLPPLSAIRSFGASVSTAGDVNGDGIHDVLIGAPFSVTIPQSGNGAGAVFLYRGTAGAAPTLSWVQPGDNANANFGASVANAGDLNGDGFADVVVGAPHNSAYQSNAGAVFVFHGADSASGIAVPANYCDPSNVFTTIPAQYCEFGPSAGALLGTSVATAGDLNADGYADAAIGIAGFPSTLGGLSAVEIVYGRGDGSYVLGDPVLSSEAIISVATAGDTDGDGFSEVLIGVPTYNGGQTNEGLVSLYRGTANPPQTNTPWQFAPTNSARTGDSIATPDVNGDGRADIVIGVLGFDNGLTDPGRGVRVLHAAVRELLVAAADHRQRQHDLLGAVAGAQLGLSVANAGDVNNDGVEDLIVGSPGDSRALVLNGSLGGLPFSVSQNLIGTAGTRFGQSLTGAGDVNGDGFADVVIGAPLDETSGALADEGVARLLRGSAGGLVATSWAAHSAQAGAQYGGRVSGAGDVNRDGYSDVLVAAPLYAGNIGPFPTTTGLVSAVPRWAEWPRDDSCLVSHGRRLGRESQPDRPGPRLHRRRRCRRLQRSVAPIDQLLGAQLARAAGLPGQGDAPLFLASLPGVTAAGGDVTGDGLSDLVVGDSGALTANLFAGPIASTTPIWTLTGPANSEFGGRVATGDVNGDGISDVLVGAPGFDNAFADAGRVSLYLANLGAGDNGFSLQPFQSELVPPGCNFCLLKSIALLGRTTSSPQNFFVSANAHSAAGSTRLRFQWEVKSLGSALNGAGLGQNGPVGVLGAFQVVSSSPIPAPTPRPRSTGGCASRPTTRSSRARAGSRSPATARTRVTCAASRIRTATASPTPPTTARPSRAPTRRTRTATASETCATTAATSRTRESLRTRLASSPRIRGPRSPAASATTTTTAGATCATPTSRAYPVSWSAPAT